MLEIVFFDCPLGQAWPTANPHDAGEPEFLDQTAK